MDVANDCRFQSTTPSTFESFPGLDRRYEAIANGTAISYERTVPSQIPRIGKRYLTATLKGMIVETPEITVV